MTKQASRLEVDDSVVRIETMEREQDHLWADGSVSYRQRSLYRVLVDDVHRGYLCFPNGWGGAWEACVLHPQNRYDATYHKQDDEEKARYGLFSYYRKLDPDADIAGYDRNFRRWKSRDDILHAFAKLVKLGRAPSPEQEAAEHDRQKAAYEERLRDDAERKVRWAQEDAARTAAKAEAARIAEEKRLETLEGLNAILARETLSNFERDCLMTAIARFSN